jgi:hypothetical protein
MNTRAKVYTDTRTDTNNQYTHTRYEKQTQTRKG